MLFLLQTHKLTSGHLISIQSALTYFPSGSASGSASKMTIGIRKQREKGNQQHHQQVFIYIFAMFSLYDINNEIDV